MGRVFVTRPITRKLCVLGRMFLSPRLGSLQLFAASATAKADSWPPAAGAAEPLTTFRKRIDAATFAGIALSAAAAVKAMLVVVGRLLRVGARIGLACILNGHERPPPLLQ